MEIAGEAATKLSAELLAKYPSPHWEGLKDMRIILAHKYGDVDHRIVWGTLKQDYPGLVIFVTDVLATY